MKNYKDSDYALNKFSKGIVYRFADRIAEITLKDYLAENTYKTLKDFIEFKALSDLYQEELHCWFVFYGYVYLFCADATLIA
ncbi:hypothetical protein DSECCO2_270830 [anaerobic digester metagenome]